MRVSSNRTTVWATAAFCIALFGSAVFPQRSPLGGGLAAQDSAPGGIGAPGSCARRVDQRSGAPLSESVTGEYLSRDTTPGGGFYLTMHEDAAAAGAPSAMNVSRSVWEATTRLEPGTRITLVRHARNAASGAMTAFDCIEYAP